MRSEKTKSPSVWINIAAIFILITVILFSLNYVKKWTKTDVKQPQEPEIGIVMEDLESETPLAESEPFVAPEVGVQPTEEASLPKKEDPQKQTGEKEAEKKTVAIEKPVNPYANDPYTNGGELDLDRPENFAKFFPNEKRGKTFIKQKIPLGTPSPINQGDLLAQPTSLKERDLFIPFQSGN